MPAGVTSGRSTDRLTGPSTASLPIIFPLFLSVHRQPTRLAVNRPQGVSSALDRRTLATDAGGGEGATGLPSPGEAGGAVALGTGALHLTKPLHVGLELAGAVPQYQGGATGEVPVDHLRLGA